DLVAVGLAQPYSLARAGLVQGLDRRGAGRLRYPGEVLLARGEIGEADEGRIVGLVGNVNVMARPGAPHIERIGCARGTDHPEVGEELLLRIEVRSAEAAEGEVAHLDERHSGSPNRRR